MNKPLANNLQEYCDYSCKYATFVENDLSGACRRESAVYCNLLKKYNNKNAKCLVDEKIKRKK
jgi:hypothetical protein